VLNKALNGNRQVRGTCSNTQDHGSKGESVASSPVGYNVTDKMRGLRHDVRRLGIEIHC
jgi:hypothetical protein